MNKKQTVAELASQSDWKVIETQNDFPDDSRTVWVTLRRTGEVSTNGFPDRDHRRSSEFIDTYSAWMDIERPKPYVSAAEKNSTKRRSPDGCWW